MGSANYIPVGKGRRPRPRLIGPIATARRCLVGAALVLFALSLRMPSHQGSAWGNGTIDSGWVCLLAGVPFYPSNALLVLSPLMLWVVSAFDDGRDILWYVFAWLYTASAALVLFPGLTDGTPPTFLVGYKVWAVAHCVAALAFWIPLVRRDRGTCQSCGYNLTGNVSGVCPECGTGRRA